MKLATSVTALALYLEMSGTPGTIVIGSGDSDMLPAIQMALDRNIKVEVWAWSRCMSQLFNDLARENTNLSLVMLNPYIDKIGFVDTHFNRTRQRIEDFPAVVVRGLSEREIVKICDESRELSSEWWTSPVDHNSTGVAIVFHDATHIDHVRAIFSIQEGVTVQLYGEFMNLASSACALPPSRTKRPRVEQPKAIPADGGLCYHGFRCGAGIRCKFTHTAEQNKFFKMSGGSCPRYYKLKLCTHAQSGTCKHMHTPAFCPYAHSEEETWCLNCKCAGHQTDSCRGVVRELSHMPLPSEKCRC